MSAVDNANRDPLAGLSLDALLTSERLATSSMTPSPAPPAQVSRTLLDIIRDEEPHGSLFGHKDKKSWKAFRDRLRLKRAGAAWTSSVPIPASDIPIHNASSVNPNTARFNSSRSLMSRRNSLRYTTLSSVPNPSDQISNPDASASVPTSRPVMTRRTSTRYSDSPQSEEVDIHAVSDLPPATSFRPQMSRRNSTRVPETNVEVAEEDEEEPVTHEGTRRLATVLAEERALSAREAVAAQEAAEAEAAAQAAEEEEEEEAEEGVGEAQPVRMSLMDLLEETDRQMGLVGSRYTMGAEEEKEDEEEEEEEEGEEVGRVEHTCCVCMVRHKGAAFIPCGHTFCRFCSRELWVQRGNCPLCNGFILEILDIF